jgi:hypothetical protein
MYKIVDNKLLIHCIRLKEKMLETITQGFADPNKLEPNPWNTNIVSPENELKIEASIKEFGLFKPIIVREIEEGRFEILGGEHRARVAIKMGLKEVPVTNLGPIDTDKAKKIGLVDNGRYGEDDTLQLADLLKELGDIEDLSSILPYSEDDITNVFTSGLALEDLELPDLDDYDGELPTTPVTPTTQILRFKVPIEDATKITTLIEKTMKQNGLTNGDSYENAGNALITILNDKAGTW